VLISIYDVGISSRDGVTNDDELDDDDDDDDDDVVCCLDELSSWSVIMLKR